MERITYTAILEYAGNMDKSSLKEVAQQRGSGQECKREQKVDFIFPCSFALLAIHMRKKSLMCLLEVGWQDSVTCGILGESIQ